MGKQSWRNKLTCAALCSVAFFFGLVLRPQQPSLQQISGASSGGGARSSPTTDGPANFRVYPKPDRLCLSAPYNACVDVLSEPDSLYAELLKTCPASGCTVLDIGANRGDFIEATLQIAPQTKIVAFEPHPLLSHDLERRFGDVENVKLYKAGLSVAPGTLHAAVSVGKGYQAVKFIKSCDDITDLQRERYNKTCQTIPTIALDNVVDFPVNIMKVDVQGHELDVLLGGFTSFVKRGYDIILSELSPSLFESEAHARLYLKMLASRGYRIYALQQLSSQFKRSLVELPPEGEDVSTWTAISNMRSTGSWMDILCVREGLERA